MSPELLNTFVVGCVALIVVLLGFFARQWAGALQGSVMNLTTAIHDLSKAFANMDKLMVGFEKDLKAHGEDIDELFERRCPNPDCSLFTTDPDVVRLRQRRRGDVNG